MGNLQIIIRKFSKNKSKVRHNKLKKLETELQELQHLQYKDKTENVKNKTNALEIEIENIYNFKSKDTHIRSRIKFLGEGEKNQNISLTNRLLTH